MEVARALELICVSFFGHDPQNCEGPSNNLILATGMLRDHVSELVPLGRYRYLFNHLMRRTVEDEMTGRIIGAEVATG